MKLQELYEDSAVKLQSNYKELVSLIKSKCFNNFKALMDNKAKMLFRGTNQPGYKMLPNEAMFLVSAERTTPRKSATDHNLILQYTALHPSWKNVPSRSYSSSATPSYQHASEFLGSVWVIIPFDDVDILAVTDEDFNFHGLDDGRTLMDVGTLLMDISNECRTLAENEDEPIDAELKKLVENPAFELPADHEFSLSDMQNLAFAIEELADYFDTYSDDDNTTIMDLIDYVRDLENATSRNLWFWMVKNFTPEKMGVKLMKYDETSKIKNSSEVWFRGKYLALKTSGKKLGDISDLLEQLEKDVV